MAQYETKWLEAIDFDAILDYYDYPQEFYRERLHQELDSLAKDEALNRICWLTHYILVHGSNEDILNVWTWGATPFQRHGSPTLCVVAMLAAQPFHTQTIARCGYDEEQAENSRKSLRNCWTGQRARGVDGVSFGLMLWMSYFVRCNLVRLGRLQYECGVRGFPKYDHLFEGEPVYIYIHIPPADNGLQDDEVAESIRQAREKLAQYFPEIAAEGKTPVYCTNTWLLSPQLREFLKPDSNIMKFQNRFRVEGRTESVGAFLNFVFKVTELPGTFDYNTLPEDTHLRRELKSKILRGVPLEVGWGYIPM